MHMARGSTTPLSSRSMHRPYAPLAVSTRPNQFLEEVKKKLLDMVKFSGLNFYLNDTNSDLDVNDTNWLVPSPNLY